MGSNSQKTEAFLTLLMANQRRINSYILSLVPNFNDADDIMQETITVMWRKFDRFEIGTDFAGWGLKVAYYCIMNYRRSKSKDKVLFSDNLFEQIQEIAKQKQGNIGPASLDAIRFLTRPAWLAGNERNRFHQRQPLGHIRAIGRRTQCRDQFGRFFSGLINDLRIYNYALDEVETSHLHL